MKIHDLSQIELTKVLSGFGLRLRIGVVNVSVTSDIGIFSDHLMTLYKDFDILSDNEFIDINIVLSASSFIRSIYRPQVNFSFDGFVPFNPLPALQAGAVFEWGLNWCIANTCHQFLIIHSAVIEKNDMAFLLPGMPGAGKSTLCAALICKGWRLLSDEMALLSLTDGYIYPICRPISLKNQSISIIAQRFPNVVMSNAVEDTAKGRIAHMRPPISSINDSQKPASPARIIFPKYSANSGFNLSILKRGDAFMKIIRNSFNYNVLGHLGFESLNSMISQSDCYEFEYNSLDDAFDVFDELALF